MGFQGCCWQRIDEETRVVILSADEFPPPEKGVKASTILKSPLNFKDLESVISNFTFTDSIAADHLM